jgi:hypothetical protein
MRFEYYHPGLDTAPKLSIDGTVSNSVHFSHWAGNRTPASVKADTSTEIALNLVASPERAALTQGIELVTNNHFDTDGVLSVWTVLQGERALGLRDRLVAAAEAGDFSAYSTKDGVRASIVIQGSDAVVPGEDAGSPLARHLSGREGAGEARSYELILPEVERVITHTDDYEFLWRDVWQRIEAALESFARSESTVEEDQESGLSVVALAPGLYGSRGFSPTKHAAPFTAISHHARGRLFPHRAPDDGRLGLPPRLPLLLLGRNSRPPARRAAGFHGADRAAQRAGAKSDGRGRAPRALGARRRGTNVGRQVPG